MAQKLKSAFSGRFFIWERFSFPKKQYARTAVVPCRKVCYYDSGKSGRLFQILNAKGYAMNILFFMKPKNEIAYILETSTLRQALEKMKHSGYSAIPVIDEQGHYAGTLSEGDLLWAVLDKNACDIHNGEKVPVRDLPQRRQNTPINVNAQIEDLLLTAMNQNFVPVTDDRGLFIGIVTRRDIMQHFYDKAQSEKME